MPILAIPMWAALVLASYLVARFVLRITTTTSARVFWLSAIPIGGMIVGLAERVATHFPANVGAALFIAVFVWLPGVGLAYRRHRRRLPVTPDAR